MCGVIGAVAQRNVVPILLEGLRRLEYRGYDSAGLAINQQGLQRVRSVGRVASLAEAARQQHLEGECGIAHTRWATHGVPSEDNAHPHTSHDQVAVVHNGIIENHENLRAELQALGYVFQSQTDTEVIAHLVHHYLQDTTELSLAVRKTIQRLEGTYAILVMAEQVPHRLVCARRGSPLLIGLGIEENFVASDVSALLPVTQRIIYLEDGDLADIGLLSIRIEDVDGHQVDRQSVESELSAEMAELGPWRHFMQKEIHEQPRALSDTLQDALMSEHLAPGLFGPEAGQVFAQCKSVLFLACGTSFHAALVATYWIEALVGLPCRAEIASEYRYRESVPDAQTLVITLSQSGETADTLAALRHAQAMGHDKTLCICNVPESSLVRASRLRFITRAGPEVGVASTKAFTTQLAALFVLTLLLAKQQGRLSDAHEAHWMRELRALPQAVGKVLELEPAISAWAALFTNKHHALFLGRGVHYPIALEGALKLKEISYIHAEAYPAGELKHGPLALIDSEMPVVAIAPNDQLLDKLKSNLHEVSARGGELYVFTDEDTQVVQPGAGIHQIQLHAHAGWLSPILHTVPLQLLAYHAALQKGTDVDKPRNLAKSVTVE